MKQVLVCKNCHRELSKPVVIYNEAKAGFEYEELEGGYLKIIMSSVGPKDVFPVIDYDKEPLEQGLAYKPIQPFPLHFDQLAGPLQFMPQYWLNGRDLKHRVRIIDTNDPNYFTLADVDLNMNMSCRCSQEIGWMSEGGGMFIPNNDKTYWANPKPLSQSPIARFFRWLNNEANPKNES